MAEIKKDAGQARQRPRHPVTRQTETQARAPVAKPAGIAPVFDAPAAQLKAREGPYKGMISNPWVKQWTQGAQGQTPQETTGPSEVAGTEEEAEPKAPAPGRRRMTFDAGPAPEPTHGDSA